MNDSACGAFDTIVFNEAQLLLAEKRTALSTLRTGIAVFALPLSVTGALIATSRYYDATRVLHLLVPLMLLNLSLVGLGIYLVVRAIMKLRHYDRLMNGLKAKHSAVAELLD